VKQFELVDPGMIDEELLQYFHISSQLETTK